MDGYSSSDEESISEQDGAVVKRIYKDYEATLNWGNDVDLRDRLQLHSITCLICISSVKRKQKIWTCSNCYDTFHLTCIQQWVRDGVVRKGVLSDQYFPTREIPWNCPKCRYAYDRSKRPDKYFCFCGRVESPESDPWLAAHSCGQKCDRPLRPKCGHRCMLLCHPGPCPPCPKMVKTSCFCGKSGKTVRRCGASNWSCGKTCSKLLSCLKHSCKEICHDGSCPSCEETVTCPCVCGKKFEKRLCGTSQWQCDIECGKILPCNVHRCKKICHDGNCGECPKSGVRTCPCGKTKYEVVIACTEDVPTCKDTCGKKLDCPNGHRCQRRCHYGECSLCSIMVKKKCRCGKKEKELPCSKEYLCNVKCQKMRDCGVHLCKKMCCDGNCQSCDQVCMKTLQCKRHKCQLLCHRGKCFPCNLRSKVSCKCGSTTVSVMCGKEKSTKPPRCNKLCNTPSTCHHPFRRPHPCHFNKCPPCNQICGNKLECGHTCKESCHDEVQVEVKVSGPWELAHKSSFTVEKQPCPPCRHQVSMSCYGEHESSMMDCSVRRQYDCGRECGRILNCGVHNCEMKCHIVAAEHPKSENGLQCRECEKPCTKPRPNGCTHRCRIACHQGPCNLCKKQLRIPCHCGLMQLQFLCCEFTSANGAAKDLMLSCGNECQKLLPCQHPCREPCHTGPCARSCKKKMTVKCSCKRRKKEFTCLEFRNGVVVECDEVCKEKSKQLAKEKQKELEEKNIQEKLAADKELLKYERSMNKYSKSRRKRVSQNDTTSDSLSLYARWKKHLQKIPILFIVAAVVAFSWNLILTE